MPVSDAGASLLWELTHPPLPECAVVEAFDLLTVAHLSVQEARRQAEGDARKRPMSEDVAREVCEQASAWVLRDYVTAFNLAALLHAACHGQAANPETRLPVELETEIDLCFVEAAAEFLPHAPDPDTYRFASDAAASAVSMCDTTPFPRLRGRAHIAAVRLLMYYSRIGADLSLWDLPFAQRAERLRTSEALRHVVGSPGERPAAERVAELPDPRLEISRVLASSAEILPTLDRSDRACYTAALLQIEGDRSERTTPGLTARRELATQALELRDCLSLYDRVVTATALVEYGGAIRFPVADLFDESFPELFARLGPTTGISVWAQTVNLLKQLGDHALLTRLARQMATMDLRSAAQFPPQRERLLFDMTRAMDGSGLDCAAADADADSAKALAHCIPSGLSDSDRFWAEIHAAHHAASLRIAEDLMRTRMSHVDPLLRDLGIDLKKNARRAAARSTWVNRRDAPEELLPAVITDLKETAALQLDPTLVWRRVEILAREQPAMVERILDALVPVFDLATESFFDEADRAAASCGEALNEGLIHAPPSTLTPSIVHAQLFKGRRLATSIAHPGRFENVVVERMSEYEQTRDEHDLLAVHLPADMLAMSFAQHDDRMVGGTTMALVANRATALNRIFGQGLFTERLDVARHEAALSTAADLRRHRLIDVDALLCCLGDDTALVDILTGTLDDEQVTFASLYSRKMSLRFKWHHGYDRSRTILLADENSVQPRKTYFHEQASTVAVLRELILEDPGPRRPVLREASDYLESTIISLMGQERLSSLHEAGVRRLAIWAEGALHYAPLHLFGSGAGPLADDWTVTYLPALDAISRPVTRSREHDTLVLAASARGGVPFSLTAVPALDKQIDDIAAASASMTVRVLHDADAATVLTGVPTARYVHLAAHGVADPLASWSQCLYLGDGTTHSDRLTAFRVLEADWRGVDLVTLAACETAMGRFDRLDNLSGLTSALLAAGVCAVVAAMWPVRPEPASVFFTTLYRRLAAMSSKGSDVDLRAAFRAAQLETRASFSAYRDWAAFIYVGGW